MLNLKVDVVTARFDNMLNDMAKIDPAVEFRTIVIQMAIRVCQGAANRTRAARLVDVERYHTNRFNAKEWTSFNGKKYLIKGTGNDGHLNRYPDALWANIQGFRFKRLQERIARSKAAMGLSKQTWLNMAIELGGTIEVPAYVRSANYRGRTYPGDVSHQEDSGGGTSYGLTIVNRSPIVQFAGGRGALLGAMQAEVGYFTHNMAHGFYQTLAARAAKYPGIYVYENAA